MNWAAELFVASCICVSAWLVC